MRSIARRLRVLALSLPAVLLLAPLPGAAFCCGRSKRKGWPFE